MLKKVEYDTIHERDLQTYSERQHRPRLQPGRAAVVSK